jgi:hypothetical protein
MGDSIVLAVSILTLLTLSGGLAAFVKRRRKATTSAHWREVFAGNALVLLVILSLLFLVGECYFRFGYDATDSFSETRTSRRWFERHFQRNNAGLRDSVDYNFRLQAGRRRISFVGDSFSAGHGIANVEDRFANQVRRLGRGQLDVHVLAEIGRDTGAEIKLIQHLRREGYQFDLVVLVYCLNDINDIVPEQQGLIARAAAPAARPGFLVEHSFLINTLYYRLKARLNPDASRYYDFVQTAYAGPVWEQQKSRLREMKERCEGAGGRFAVVIFPFVHSLGPEYEYRHVHALVNEFWQEMGVACLDLLPVLEPHVHERLTISVYDAHPNERAHELAGRAIFDWIRGIVE